MKLPRSVSILLTESDMKELAEKGFVEYGYFDIVLNERFVKEDT